jgi:putative ABC transport system permease protein
MTLWTRVRAFWRSIFHRPDMEQDLSDEVQFHLERRTSDLMTRHGISSDDARRRARLEFGSIEKYKEQTRQSIGLRLIDELFADLRYAVRRLRATPSFAAAAVMTLALGIGANTAVFSVVNALVFRPLPFQHPERLVAVESIDVRDSAHPRSLSYPTFFEFRRSNVLADIASYRDDQVTLAGADGTHVLEAEIVSSNLFDVLGTHVAAGRGFTLDDERAGAHVAILSHGLWMARFGGDAHIAGATIVLDNEPFRVAGIAPAGFNFPVGARGVDVWVTLARDASSHTAQPLTEQRGAWVVRTIARLTPNDTIEQARARLDRVAAALAQTYPATNGNIARTSVVPELRRLLGDTRVATLVLWAAVTLVLLISCANVANMLLVRTADRERELGIRLAIGGSRNRVIRQLATENLLVGVIGSVAGLAVARGLLGLLLPVVGDHLPRATPISLEWPVVAFAAALSLVTSLFVSVPVSVRVARVDFDGALRSAPRGATDVRDRVRSALVVTQIAVGLVLLSGAATMTAGLRHFTHRDLGFRADHMVTFSVASSRGDLQTPDRLQFTNDLMSELHALPGVTDVAGSMPLPLSGEHLQLSFDIPERPSPPSARPGANLAIVTPAYFEAVGATLEEGRTFTDRDDARHPRVVIVNRALATRFFPGEHVVGKYIEPSATSDLDPPDGSTRLKQIVGVVNNIRQTPLGRDAEPIYYVPYQQLPWGMPPLLVRTAVDGAALEADIRRTVARLDRGAAVHDVRTVDGILADGVAGTRFQTLLLCGFAGIALVLVATGMYGVLSYAVHRRTREIGVRVALGASQAAIVRMIGGWAFGLVAVGVALGIAGAVAADALVRRTLVDAGLSFTLPLATVTAIVVMTAAAVACLPALRASRLDPTEALRTE